MLGRAVHPGSAEEATSREPHHPRGTPASGRSDHGQYVASAIEPQHDRLTPVTPVSECPWNRSSSTSPSWWDPWPCSPRPTPEPYWPRDRPAHPPARPPPTWATSHRPWSTC